MRNILRIVKTQCKIFDICCSLKSILSEIFATGVLKRLTVVSKTVEARDTENQKHPVLAKLYNHDFPMVLIVPQ